MVYSALDEYLGALTGMVGNIWSFHIPSLDRFLQFYVSNGRNVHGVQTLYYMEEGCYGTPYLLTSIENRYWIHHVATATSYSDSDFRHFVSFGDLIQNPTFKSHYDISLPPQPQCVTESTRRDWAYPLQEIVLPFTYPIAFPLKFAY
jgi:hypothetical protein